MADEPAPSYEANTVEELKDELRARELPTSGNKDELVARLEEDDAETEAAPETQAGEGEAPPPFYQPQVYSPWELPANTGAAQLYINNGLLVDESLVPDDERLAAANNEIELHGHPEDPRLSGGSLITEPLSLEQLANPGKAPEIEPLQLEQGDTRETVGQRVAREEAEKEEAKA